MTIATGLAVGPPAGTDLVTQAVSQAMEKAGLKIANSILLFLTPEFAHDPQPALLAASKAGNCMQIVGCSAARLSIKSSGWGPLVGAKLTPSPNTIAAAAGAINTIWLNEPGTRFGGVSGDATGQGPFKVWSGGKVSNAGRCESIFNGVAGHIAVSQGVRALSAPLEITQVSGYDVISLVQQPALNVLARELPLEVREMDHIPLHLLMAGITFGEPANAIPEGRFRLTPIISTNMDDRSVTLSSRLSLGERLFWAVRQPLAAERDMRHTLDRIQSTLSSTPTFGLLFPCMGRGPYFYGGIDRDLELVKQRFPDMPLIGFYGNGEIGPLDGQNQLYQYAAVLGLFTPHV